MLSTLWLDLVDVLKAMNCDPIDIEGAIKRAANPSPAMRDAAKRAIRSLRDRKRRYAKMTTKQRKACDRRWAARLARDLSRLTD